MAGGGSKKVIIISLCANFGIALAKLGGALFTGSASLMAESVHSFSDCGNQLLLLYGQYRAKKPPTKKHPMGYGKEGFFWSFVVALMLFSMGGLFSIYEGVHKIQHPEEISHIYVGIIILLLGLVLEGYSFYMCLKEVRAENAHKSLWSWIRETTSSDLLVIFLEDLAALLGLLAALTFLLIAWITNNPLWDGIGSVVIGCLLVIVAIILAREVKSLLVGEAPIVKYQEKLQEILREFLPAAEIIRLVAVQQGIGEVMLAYKIKSESLELSVSEIINKINGFEEEVKLNFPEVKWQFAELDNKI
ncbi:MAG: cation efflux family transporter [Alphaproteobacteria bacterium CG11_big_fil_rev_8_21_14_0_20_44_7]|nr:MAG: cation efflux family transporter [Alphaproteobacteria bacterium CG11_big_fil_rev_8_21_14_0_20_44_7]